MGWPNGTSEVINLMSSVNWGSTSLGPLEMWGSRLRGQIETVICSAQPMYIALGPDLLLIYNDAYLPVIGDRHPEAFGAPLRQVFSDIWPELEGLFDPVLDGVPKVVENARISTPWRRERPEGRFSFSLVPVLTKDNQVFGFIASLFETTAIYEAQQKDGESAERQRFLLTLADTLHPLEEPEEIKAVATRMIGERFRVNRVFYADSEGEMWVVSKGYEADINPLPPGPFLKSNYGDWIIDTLNKGDVLVVDDIETDGRFDEQERKAHLNLQIAAEIAVPLRHHGLLAGMLVSQTTAPRNWSDSEIGIMREAGIRTAVAVELARTRRRSWELNAFLVKFSEAVRGILDPHVVAQTACRLVAEELGVERAYWSVVDWETREFVIGADHHEPEASPVRGRFPLNAWEPFSSYHLQGRPVIVSDVMTDERVPAEMRQGYKSLGIAADLAVSVRSGGTLRCVLAVNQQRARKWSPEEVALVQGAADRCWAEVERARAEIRVRKNEERQAFLLKLSDAMRPLLSADDKIRIAARLLGERLGASRILYAEYDWGKGVAHVFNGWFADGAKPFPTVMRLNDYDGEVLNDLRSGRTVRVDNVGILPDEPAYKAIADVGVQALLSPPLILDGKLVMNISVHQHDPRHWTDDEVELVQEVAERLWAEVVRARAEAALRDSQERLALAIDAGQLATWDWDLVSGEVIWNDRHFLAQGYEVGEVTPSFDAWIERVHPDDRNDAVKLIEGARDSATQYKNDFRTLHPDGLIRWCFAQGQFFYDHAGQAIRMIGVMEDVTDERLAELALKNSEERFRQFASAAASGLWIRDAATLSMEFASPAVGTIYGIDESSLLGDVERWASLIVPEDRETALRHLKAASQGQPITHEFRIQRRSDQTFRWIRNTDFPLHDDGHIARIGGIAEDVTETKVAVEHQAVLLAELQHRVRNLMGMIRSMANRSADGPTSVSDYRSSLEGRLLALARVQTLLTRQANAGGSLHDIIESEIAAQAHHAGQYDLLGPNILLSPKAVEVLTLAFHELATNALKYGGLSVPTGRVSVRWSSVEKTSGPWLILDWMEQGSPPRAPSTRRGFGSELIENKIPYELRGKATMAMNNGQASCHLEIPLRNAESILETDAPTRVTIHGGSLDMTEAPDLTGRSILVVEDDYYMASDFASALRSAGANVLGPCPTKEAALELLERETPSAVVLDLNLGGGGPKFEIAARLKEREIPFFFLTGYDPDVIPEDMKDVTRLQKPVTLRQMVDVVSSL